MKTHETDSNSLCPEGLRIVAGYGILTGEILAAENKVFANTAGTSQENRQAGFVPGYQDTQTGKTEISRYANGEPAPIHLLEGLPEDWVARRDEEGHVAETKSGIIAGFLRAGEFFTREAVIQTLAEER